MRESRRAEEQNKKKEWRKREYELGGGESKLRSRRGSRRSSLLTSQLSSDPLEWQLSELFDQRSELGAADQLMFTIVQLVHRHQAIGQDSLH